MSLCFLSFPKKMLDNFETLPSSRSSFVKIITEKQKSNLNLKGMIGHSMHIWRAFSSIFS